MTIPHLLDEAKRITSQDRQNDYGPPEDDLARTAQMWSAYTGHKFTGSDVAAMMVMVKLSRQRHRPKRDNWLDIAGYAFCGERCDAAAVAAGD